MLLGKVVGNITSTKKLDNLTGNRFLVVDLYEKNGSEANKIEGSQLIAADLVGAGREEYVLIVTGSSARKAMMHPDVPIDACIIGIIDTFID